MIAFCESVTYDLDASRRQSDVEIRMGSAAGVHSLTGVKSALKALRRFLRSLWEGLGFGPETSAAGHYHAFISYSWAADRGLAPALQHGVQRLAKPWYRTRALRVFRDDSALAAGADLNTILDTLDASEYLILLASPGAASRDWVQREVSYWREHKSMDNLLIAVTDGHVTWNERVGDFDDESWKVLPKALKGAFTAPKVYVDFTWARGSSDLTLKNTQFRNAVVKLAAPIHQLRPEELDSLERTERHRTVRAARIATGMLGILVTAAVALLILFLVQHHNAQAQRARAMLARSQRLAVDAVNRSSADPEAAVEEALKALRTARTSEARAALRLAASKAVPETMFSAAQQSINAVEVSTQGRIVTSGLDGTVKIWNPRQRSTRPITLKGHRGAVESAVFAASGQEVLSAGDDGTIRVWHLETSAGPAAGDSDPPGDRLPGGLRPGRTPRALRRGRWHSPDLGPFTPTLAADGVARSPRRGPLGGLLA